MIDNFGYAFQSEGHLDLGVNIFFSQGNHMNFLSSFYKVFKYTTEN